MNNLIPTLAAELKRRGITQKNLAQQLGVTQQAVSAILRGRSNPSLSVFVRMCEVAGIEITLTNIPPEGGGNIEK